MKRLSISRSGRALLAAALAVVIGVGGWWGYETLRPADTTVIHPSYAFDVTDLRQVAGFADHVLVGRVTAVDRVAESNGVAWTTFGVEVLQVLKGDVSGTVLVDQQGGKIGKDVWRVEGVSPLAVSGTYLIAVTDENGQLTSVGGPSAPRRLGNGSERAAAVSQWKDAVAHQRWPDHLPRE